VLRKVLRQGERLREEVLATNNRPGRGSLMGPGPGQGGKEQEMSVRLVRGGRVYVSRGRRTLSGRSIPWKAVQTLEAVDCREYALAAASRMVSKRRGGSGSGHRTRCRVLGGRIKARCSLASFRLVCDARHPPGAGPHDALRRMEGSFLSRRFTPFRRRSPQLTGRSRLTGQGTGHFCCDEVSLCRQGVVCTRGLFRRVRSYPRLA
jgi:hypothetical protein